MVYGTRCEVMRLENESVLTQHQAKINRLEEQLEESQSYQKICEHQDQIINDLKQEIQLYLLAIH